MSFEDSHSPMITSKDPEGHLDRLIQEFPTENQNRLEARIAGKSIAEQIAIVEEALKRRREILKRPRHVSSHLKMVERIPDTVFDRFLHKDENQIEVGRGENGRVFEYRSAEDAENTVVFKMLVRAPMDDQNDLLEEGAYQADVATFADQHTPLRIGVPKPYYIAASAKGYVLAMEKLPGYSVEEICGRNIPVPQHININEIESRLTEFVQRMNSVGFYHRDLREGNIMINFEPRDQDAPLAYVIDFGFCTKADNQEDAYQTIDGARDHVMIHKVLDKIRARQDPRHSEYDYDRN